MKANVALVLIAQFLTAFADNALMFTIITMVTQSAQRGDWYIPALQASFLVAFVLLAPWVGSFADTRAKSNVMTYANIIKAMGAGLLFVQTEPLLAYAIVGLGAAMYGPAKYGILPELVGETELVKANGWIEGSTILAILGGTIGGAYVAESISVTFALVCITTLYGVSAFAAKWIVSQPAAAKSKVPLLPLFIQLTRRLLATPRARFATLGVSLFWAASVVLRVLLVSWAAEVLFITNTEKVAELTLFLAIGIAVGAFLVPRFIPLAYLRRARLAAYAMGLIVLLLAVVTDPWSARVVLFLTGVAGGMFVVPINAALQEIGHKSIGAGGAVAVQNFFENLSMLLASGLYALATAAGAKAIPTVAMLGILILIATALVSWHLPPDTGKLENSAPPE